MDPEADTEELIQAIVEKPKYNSDNREPKRVTPEMMKAVEECLEMNEWRRANGMSKQQMKKIDICEALNEEGFKISYSAVTTAINRIEQKWTHATTCINFTR